MKAERWFPDARARERRALFPGTHFATRPAGRIEPHGDAFRFVPVA